MRLKKGSKVEVLKRAEVPTGYWRCGEIVSGNGHNYYVDYSWRRDSKGTPNVEKVPRKDIRPCPPVEIVEDWAPGDLLEVFDEMLWKVATVSQVISQTHCVVRVIGSPKKIKAHKRHLRARQTWHEGKWAVIRKRLGCRILETDKEMGLHVKDGHHPVDSKIGFKEPLKVCFGTLKRRSYCALPNNVYAEASCKARESEKKCRHHYMDSENQSSLLPEKVVAASTQNMLDEYNTDAFFDNRTLESNDVESIASSVGSSSFP